MYYFYIIINIAASFHIAAFMGIKDYNNIIIFLGIICSKVSYKLTFYFLDLAAGELASLEKIKETLVEINYPAA